MRNLHRRQQSSFVWGFNNVKGTTLSECAITSIFLGTSQMAGQPAAVPPYTFIVYPEQGIPTVYPLSLTGTAATWTNPYPLGTTLMFNVADANGNSGGIPPEIYTVVAGDKACLLPASTPTITMKIDEPGELKTCTVLPIHIEGGQKPYTVTLAVANSSSPSNRTMGINDDTYEWVNQAAPNSTFIVAVSDSKGQYAVTSKLYQSASTGTTDVSCPGQVSRSYNSKDPNHTGSTTTTSTNSTSGNGGSNNGDKGNNNNPQIPLGAIIGAAIGGVVLLGLLFLLFFRRKKNDRRGEKGGVRERARYHRPPLDHSPDGSQSPLAHNYIGEPVYQDNGNFTPFVLPARESAALSYYGNNPTSATQGGFPQYAPPSSVLPPTKYQRPEDQQQRTQSIAWQPGYVYPPPSPAPTSVYQGLAPTEARTSYSADVVPPLAHRSPGQTSTTLRSSVYSDSVSRKSTYTAPSYPPQSPGSERNTFAQGTTETKGDPLLNPPGRPTGAPRPVFQHEDAGGVVELPPAYRDYTAPTSAPPPP